MLTVSSTDTNLLKSLISVKLTDHSYDIHTQHYENV